MAASGKLSSVLDRAKEKKEVPPDLQTVLLMDIGETLVELSELQAKILKHMEETTPEGVTFPIKDVTVTTTSYTSFITESPYRKIRGIDFFNKGPNTVYVRVNGDKELSIEDKEQISVRKPRATIDHVTMRVAPGESATVRRTGYY